MAVRPIDGNSLIEWFRPYLHTGEPIPADVVIEDIRSMPTLAPPNEPLTLEQLREMDGEPVWVQTPGIPQYGRWVIVAGIDTNDGQKTLYCQGDYTCRNYGQDWLAYRRPPEGEA